MTRTLVTKSATVLLGVALIGGLAACTGSPGAQTSTTSTSSNSRAGSGGGAANAETGSRDVVLTVASDAVLKEDYDTLDQLAASPNVRLVVTGKIVKATPVYQEQVAYTKLTVTVRKSSSSGVPAGSTIVVYRDGGRIPLSQVLPDLKSDQAAMLPASPPTNAVVDFRFMGAAQSAAGDEILAFLQADPNADRAGAYQPVSSVHGLLTLDPATTTYHRLGDEKRAGYETSANVATAERFTRRRS